MTLEKYLARMSEIKAREEAATPGNEVWKDIPECPGYQVSDFGNVRSKRKKGNFKEKMADRWRLLKQFTRKDGRKTVSVPFKNGSYYHKFVSHLVMLSFVGPRPEKMDIAHLNGDCTDNRLSNLIYCSHKENESHKKLHGTDPAGERNSQAKLQNWQVEEIKYLASKNVPTMKIAALFDLSHKDISAITLGKAWSHVSLRTDLPALREALELAVEALEALGSKTQPNLGMPWDSYAREALSAIYAKVGGRE